jgi:aspartate kinase
VGKRIGSSKVIIVQKYGGTSVGTVERIQSVAKRISGQVASGMNQMAVVVSAMAGETNRIVGLVNEVNPLADHKSYDMAVAAGEQVSVGLLCAALRGNGVRAEPLLAYQLGVITDDLHAKARIQLINTERIEQCWEQGEIPVVAGFQGVTRNLEITTLGRGGSDTSAVALAVALHADLCEINTDVDGVLTADPRVVPNARLIEVLDYDVALELSALGSKVLHSRSVELGAKYSLPMVVRHSFCPDEKRSTKLVALNEKQALEAPVVSGVTLDRSIGKITLRDIPHNKISEVFSKVAAREINVDIIVHDKHDVGFTVAGSELNDAADAVKDMASLEKTDGLSKVSVVGLGMRSHPGVASKVFSVLSENDIEVLMISTSEIKISCVVREGEGEHATRLLHAAFFD